MDCKEEKVRVTSSKQEQEEQMLSSHSNKSFESNDRNKSSKEEEIKGENSNIIATSSLMLSCVEERGGVQIIVF